jgi:hypothetical protein
MGSRMKGNAPLSLTLLSLEREKKKKTTTVKNAVAGKKSAL